MKKTYISPSIDALEVELESIVLGSKFDTSEPGSQSIIPDPSEPAPGEFTSREDFFWDDEDF